MNGTSPPRPRPGQVALGLFVVGQLVFILAANFLPLLRIALGKVSPAAERPVALAVEGTGYWARATGQLQGWSLYAPRVPTQSVFIAVELRWDDDARWPAPAGARREVLRSAIEPDDPHRFFRPFGAFRLHGCEADLSLVAWSWDTDSGDRDPEEWQRRFAAAVRKDWPLMQAYLAWRCRGYRRDHPDEPGPRQAILLARIWYIPPPGQRPWSWTGPVEQAIARWRPVEESAPGDLPVEAYNPLARRFEPVAAEEARDE
jgi:hypothetical protein